MNRNQNRLRARFAPEIRFEVEPLPASLARGRPEAELDQLKDRLLEPLLRQTADAELVRRLRRAANEAATLAWLTPFPLLVLPVLLDEKAETAKKQATRQQAILLRGRGPWEQAA